MSGYARSGAALDERKWDMIGRQVEKLKTMVAEALGVHASDLTLAYQGPDFRLWLLAAFVIGGVLFGIVGLGGAIGGGLIGVVVGSWFLIANPFIVAVDDESTYLIRMSQSAFSSARPEEVLRRDPVGSGVVSRDGRRLCYADVELQLLLLWGGRAAAVAAAAEAVPARR